MKPKLESLSSIRKVYTPNNFLRLRTPNKPKSEGKKNIQGGIIKQVERFMNSHYDNEPYSSPDFVS